PSSVGTVYISVCLSSIVFNGVPSVLTKLCEGVKSHHPISQRKKKQKHLSLHVKEAKVCQLQSG
ncbi:hypothetical protein ACQP3F_31825, partial [Escherichia coli]